MNARMINVFEHVEVYDAEGRFLFSADTQQEALEELRELESAA